MYKIKGNPEKFADLGVFHKLSKQFLPYAQKKLGFDKPVDINLISDPQNAKNPLAKTAYYDPNKMEVTVFVDKRHVKDILRSMSHELVHHTQNCRGEFDGGVHTGPGYAQEDGHMRKMEEEAYLEGQMLLRDFEDNLKKENQKMSRVNENKMPMKKDTEDVDGDGQTDDQVPAFLDKGDVKKKKKTGKQPPQLARAQGKDVDSEEEEAVDESHCPGGKRDEKDALEEDIFAPNHYCVHHGGVQMEGEVKLGTVIGHNWNNKLGRVTRYDMEFADGTILEGVKAEDILVTEASLANEHSGHMAKRNDDKKEKAKKAKKGGMTIDDAPGSGVENKPEDVTMEGDKPMKITPRTAAEKKKEKDLQQKVKDKTFLGKVKLEEDEDESAGEMAKKAAKKAGEAAETARRRAQTKKLHAKDKAIDKDSKKNENWTKKNKDELLFERLTKLWTK